MRWCLRQHFRSGVAEAALMAPLSTLLEVHGVPNTLVEVWLKRPPRNHVWLRLSDGRALDPSADQFNAGLPPVYPAKEAPSAAPAGGASFGRRKSLRPEPSHTPLSAP